VYTWDYSSEYLGTGSDWATQHSAIHLGLMVEDALGALGYTNAYTSTQPPAGYPYPGFESLYLGEGWAANLCNPPYAATSALGPGPYLVSLFALSPGLYWDSHGPLRLYEWWIDADIAPTTNLPAASGPARRRSGSLSDARPRHPLRPGFDPPARVPLTPSLSGSE